MIMCGLTKQSTRINNPSIDDDAYFDGKIAD